MIERGIGAQLEPVSGTGETADFFIALFQPLKYSAPDRIVSGTKEAITAIPLPLQKALGNAKYIVVFINSVSDFEAKNAFRHPRGYEQGASMQSVPSLFVSHRRAIIIATNHVDTSGSVVELKDPKESTWHEFGHAFDDYLSECSQSIEFQNAYSEDVKSIPVIYQKYFHYYLQPGAGGRRETFAEVFAQTCGSHRMKYMDKLFPHVFTFLRKKLEQFRA